MSEETRHSSETDLLSALLDRGPLNAGVFFAGSVCRHTDFPADDNKGHMHLVHRGPVTLVTEGKDPVEIIQPSLVMLAEPIPHRILCSEGVGAELVCARLSFDAMVAHPRLLGLPDELILPFADVPGLDAAAKSLFDEAFSERFGRMTVLNSLVELLLLYLLRYCVASNRTDRGLLAGLADPKLARALVALHEDPAADWCIENLADAAGMSRANFAATFKMRIGVSPGNYLTSVRLTLAKQKLRAGERLKAVAPQVGYKSTTALSRVFERHFGTAPRDWLHQESASM